MKRLIALLMVVALQGSAVVPTTTTSVTYSAVNGTTTSFAVPFKILRASDLVVTVNGVLQTLTTNYTVSVLSTTATVRFTVAPASGTTVLITRQVPFTQLTEFRSQGSLTPKSLTDGLDNLEFQIQQGSIASCTTPLLCPGAANTRILSIPKASSGISGFLSAADWSLFNNAQLASTNNFQIPGVGSIVRPISDKLGETISVKDYGAKGDNATNDATALQNFANYLATNGGRGYLPCGTYIINSSISIAPTFFGFTLEGAASNCVTIKAGAAMTSVISFTDTGANGRFSFRNLTIDANALAQYGLKSTQFRYGKLEKIVVQGATVAGAHFMSGWDIVVRDSEFNNNTGDGFVLGDSNGNDLTLDKVLLTANGGFGARFYGGGPIAIRGGAVQQNQKGGFYFVNQARPALVDAVYFEQNAQTGITFTTPAKTVKADIIANGANATAADTNLSFAFPNTNVTVRSCLFSATYTETAIYAAAASSMNLVGNYASVGGIPLLKTWGDSSIAKPQNVAISGNVNFSKDWDVDSLTTARPGAFSTWSSDSVARINYFPRDVYKIAKVATSSGTSILKRGATKYQGNETYEIDQGAGDTFGIIIDTTVNTELANQLVYISAWAKASATTSGPRLLMGLLTSTSSLAVDTNWHHIELAAFAPAAGTLVVGVGKLGSTPADVVTFSRIVVSVVGASDREFLRDLLPFQWSTTAAPTIGTWALGDVVWNSQPAAAGVPGWVCTTAGTPGVWKAMAALAP